MKHQNDTHKNKSGRPAKSLSEKRKYRVTVKMSTEECRYIKMKGNASSKSIAELEDFSESNRNRERIDRMREDVETYEVAVREQTALIEQALLKKQAAREQESKADSIRNKSSNPR